MSEYPKKFVKGGDVKSAHNKRDEVRLKFAGYVVAHFDVTPTNEAPPESHVELVGRLLSEDEMAKEPEAKDAEVVDLTVKPSAPKRRN